MTLQASGSMTGADIRNELGQSGGNLVFPDATTRWLSEKPSGSIVLPTDLYSKLSVKIVDSRQQPLSGTGNVTWTGLNFGIDFPGRTLIACTCLRGTGILDISAVSIGGVGTTGRDTGYDSGGGGFSIGAGIWESAPSGTSGSVSINFGTGSLTYGGIVLLSVSNITGYAESPINLFGGGQSNFSSTMNINTNGLGVLAVANTSGSAASFSGISNRLDLVAGSFAFSVGFSNRLSFQNNRTISGNWGTPAAAYGAYGRSYTQG